MIINLVFTKENSEPPTPVTYTWEKWSADTVYSYVKNQTSVTLNAFTTIYGWANCTENSNTGTFTVGGDYISGTPSNLVSSNRRWTFNNTTPSVTSGSEVYYCTSSNYATKYYYTQVESHVKGSTQYSDVTSTSDAAYPDNGYQDGYWYIKK